MYKHARNRRTGWWGGGRGEGVAERDELTIFSPMYEIGFDVFISCWTRIVRCWLLQTKFWRKYRRNGDRESITFLVVSLLSLLFFSWNFVLQAQVEPDVCLFITLKPSKAAPGASRALRWIYQSALRAMPLQHRCDRAHSLHVVMAPLLTGSLTFVATIPLLEKSPHLYARTRINDTVIHIPRKSFSAAAVARRSLSYVSGRPSFLAPSSCSPNVLFYLFLPFFSLSFRRRITQ